MENRKEIKITLENYCVIFDMDGVLADTGPIHYESWKKMCQEIGVSFNKELFNETFGQTSPEITRRLLGANADQAEVKKRASLKEKYYRGMVRDELKPLPGVIQLIKELHENGFKLAVGSSGPPENVKLLVDALALKRFFSELISAADVKNGKPDPEVFLTAARRLGIEPKRCLVIEDAPVGIQAAKSAQMKCIALTTTHPREELIEADHIAENLSEINVNDIRELLSFNDE